MLRVPHHLIIAVTVAIGMPSIPRFKKLVIVNILVHRKRGMYTLTKDRKTKIGLETEIFFRVRLQ